MREVGEHIYRVSAQFRVPHARYTVRPRTSIELSCWLSPRVGRCVTVKIARPRAHPKKPNGPKTARHFYTAFTATPHDRIAVRTDADGAARADMP